MRLKNHMVPLTQPQVEQDDAPSSTFPEDAWLNDVAPKAAPHLVSYEDFPTIPLPSAPAAPAPALEQEVQRAPASPIEAVEYDPLDELLADENVIEVMALGPRQIYARRNEYAREATLHYQDQQQMMRAIKKRLTRAGLPMLPLVDGYLPDGSLISVVLPPNAVQGPTILIKKRKLCRMTLKELVAHETLSREMADFLNACLEARLNIMICGMRGSGRTTLLRALCWQLPEQARLVTIEEMAELRPGRRQVVELVASAGGVEGNRRVTMSDLLLHALHMLPEYIVVGECRGDELGLLLQAMDAGQQGILSTMHAQNLPDCVKRLQTPGLPASARSLDILVHTVQTRDGLHKIANIAEVHGPGEHGIKIQSVFYYHTDSNRGEKGKFTPSGLRPKSLFTFNRLHINLPRQIFVPNKN